MRREWTLQLEPNPWGSDILRLCGVCGAVMGEDVVALLVKYDVPIRCCMGEGDLHSSRVVWLQVLQMQQPTPQLGSSSMGLAVEADGVTVNGIWRGRASAWTLPYDLDNFRATTKRCELRQFTFVNMTGIYNTDLERRYRYDGTILIDIAGEYPPLGPMGD